MVTCPPSRPLRLLPDSYVYIKTTYIYATDRYTNATASYINAEASLHSATTRHEDFLYITVADSILSRNYKLRCSRNSQATRRHSLNVRRRVSPKLSVEPYG